MGDVLLSVPVSIGIHLGHCSETYGDDMCKAEVEEHNFYKGPILFVVVVLDEGNLEFLKLLQRLRNLGDNEESEEKNNLIMKSNIESDDENVDNIYDKRSL